MGCIACGNGGASKGVRRRGPQLGPLPLVGSPDAVVRGVTASRMSAMPVVYLRYNKRSAPVTYTGQATNTRYIFAGGDVHPVFLDDAASFLRLGAHGAQLFTKVENPNPLPTEAEAPAPVEALEPDALSGVIPDATVAVDDVIDVPVGAEVATADEGKPESKKTAARKK